MAEGYNMFSDLPSIPDSEHTASTMSYTGWLPPHSTYNISESHEVAKPLLKTGWEQLQSSTFSTHPFGFTPWSSDHNKHGQWSYPACGVQASQGLVSPWASTVGMAPSSTDSSYDDRGSSSPASTYMTTDPWSPLLTREDIEEPNLRSPKSEHDYVNPPGYNHGSFCNDGVYNVPSCIFPARGDTIYNGVKLEEVQKYPDSYPEEQFNNISDTEVKLPYYFGPLKPSDLLHRQTFEAPESHDVPGLVKEESVDDTTSEHDNDSVSECCPASRYIKAIPSATKGQRRSNAWKGPRPTESTKTQRGRVSKSSQEKKRANSTTDTSTLKKVKCPRCFKFLFGKAALEKHIANTHTRPFSCTFRQYGCSSTFGSKNEWKRHVSSQHLRLGIWRCDIGTCDPFYKDKGGFGQQQKCGDGEADEPVYNEFNRKDLFTQHLRRMHIPDAEMAQDKAAFSAWSDKQARRCLMDIRSPPPKSVCGFCVAENDGRGIVFTGHASWEARMEHVGRHLESGHGHHRVWSEDLELRQWMVEQKLVEGNDRVGWRLSALASGVLRGKQQQQQQQQ